MEECIFCKIIDNKLPAQKVYEDSKTLAFLSIQPIREGHILIIPKTHNPDMFDLSEDDYQAVMYTAYKLVPVIEQVYKPIRTGSFIAGWDVPHAHLHLVPMQEANDVTSKRLLNGSAKIVDQNELRAQRDKIIAKLK